MAQTLPSFRWKDTACVLAIHVDRGFSLTEKATQKELWSQPYANLCSSNDDGAKLLWLQFRGRQEEDEFVKYYDFEQAIAYWGYQWEPIEATTRDGYKLTLFHITGGPPEGFVRPELSTSSSSSSSEEP